MKFASAFLARILLTSENCAEFSKSIRCPLPCRSVRVKERGRQVDDPEKTLKALSLNEL